MKWYNIRLSTILWCVEFVIIGAAIRAVMTDHNAWPLVLLAVVFGFFIPKKEEQ